MNDEKNVSNPPKQEQDSQPRFNRGHNDHNWGGNLVGAMFFIGLGLVFLLNNLGVLPWGIWGTLWRFWPLFLILIGLQLILGKSRIASVIMTLITLLSCAAIIGLAVLFTSDSRLSSLNIDTTWINRLQNSLNIRTNEATKTYEVQEDQGEDAESREVSIDIGSSSFTLSDSSSRDFFKVDATYPDAKNEPELKSDMNGENLLINFKSASQNFAWFGTEHKYDMTIGRSSLPTSLNLQVGSGSGSIDLNTLVLNSANINLSSGSINAVLSKESLPSENLTLNVSSGSLALDLPSEVGYRVEYKVSSGNLNIFNRNLSGEGVYTSENYRDATEVVDFSVNVSSGSVVVK